MARSSLVPSVSDRPAYFAVADRQLRPFIRSPTRAFEESLFDNLALQPSGLLVPDILFFISPEVETHMMAAEKRQGGLSLLEAAVGRGKVVPAFRDESDRTFKAALTTIRKQGIQGVLNNADWVANRLDHAAKNRDAFRLHSWKRKDTGVAFKTFLEGTLGAKNPPSVPKDAGASPEKLRDFWDATERWRTDCVQEAAVRTRAGPALRGLRRGDLQNVMGEYVGLGRGCVVHDQRQILSANVDEFTLRNLRRFLKLVNEAYETNQAEELGGSSSFPVWDSLTPVVAGAHLDGVQDYSGSVPLDVFHRRVRMPSARLLVHTTPTAFLDLVEDKGKDYFEAVEIWQQDGSQDTSKRLGDAADFYAKALTKKLHESEGGLMDIVLARVPPENKQIAKQLIWGVPIALTTAPLPIPPNLQAVGAGATALTVIGEAGHAVYRRLRHAPRNVGVHVPIRQPRRKELNVSVPR